MYSKKCFFHYWLVRLSGYENTLLGYRSRHYRLVKDHPDAMDTIMFGGRSLVKYKYFVVTIMT